MKILSVLTEPLKRHAEHQPYRIPILESDDGLREIHAILRCACEQRQKLQVSYQDEQGRPSERVLWPLGMIGWSGCWTLLAWCELRRGYRDFRFDRFEAVTVLAEQFEPGDEIGLAHYIQHVVGVRDSG